MSVPYRSLVLAIHPSVRGFGWIAFEGPFSPYDWGVVCARGSDKNSLCLKRIEKLLRRLTPETLVLETFCERRSNRRTRVTALGNAIVALATDRGVDLAIYPFRDVRSYFAHLGAKSRWEIAAVVARQQYALTHLLPKKRKPWEPESRRLALFCAAALALTHYQRDARTLLESLSSPDSSF